MSYLIFGIVVMLMTWWIVESSNHKIIIKKNIEIDNLIERNNFLSSELITQKAMREGKN